jgi:hypothetical protein
MKKLIEIKKSEFQKLYSVACDTWKAKFNKKFEKFLFEDYLQFEESFIEEMKSACDPAKPSQLKTLNEIFKDYFKDKVDLFNIITYKEVCKALGEKLITEESFSHLPVYMVNKAVAQAKIQQLEKFFNGDWIKDWNNSNQRKYYPWFEKRSGGWVFYGSDCGECRFSGVVGFYKDQPTSDHIGKNFMDIYIQAS